VIQFDTFVIYQSVTGWRAHGLEETQADVDHRGVYLASPELQWSLFGAPDHFEDHAEQSRFWELQKFLILALDANPDILECLYSPVVEKVTPLGRELLALRDRFLSQKIYQSYLQVAQSQYEQIEQAIRAHREVPWDCAFELVRLLLTGTAALREGRVPVRVEENRERLLALQRGQVPWAQVDSWREQLNKDLAAALSNTRLPERPDYEAANQFLVQARWKNVLGELDAADTPSLE
jgi:predicted nucleotidyltransferase